MLLTGFHGSCYARSVYTCTMSCVCVSIEEMIACANMAVTMSNKSGSGGPRAVGWQESHTVIRFHKVKFQPTYCNTCMLRYTI